jgi:hypothetical protein
MSFAKIRPRRGTKSEWEVIDPILFEGEFGIEFPDSGVGTGLCKFKIGDGTTKWSELPYAFDAGAAVNIDAGDYNSDSYIYLKRGTTEQWEQENPILEDGEIVYDQTKKAIKIGDGVTAFKDLDYIGYNWEMEQEYDFGDIDDGPIIPGPDDEDYDFGDIAV